MGRSYRGKSNAEGVTCGQANAEAQRDASIAGNLSRKEPRSEAQGLVREAQEPKNGWRARKLTCLSEVGWAVAKYVDLASTQGRLQMC